VELLVVEDSLGAGCFLGGALGADGDFGEVGVAEEGGELAVVVC
jgi:hypothetical protein